VIVITFYLRYFLLLFHCSSTAFSCKRLYFLYSVLNMFCNKSLSRSLSTPPPPFLFGISVMFSPFLFCFILCHFVPFSRSNLTVICHFITVPSLLIAHFVPPVSRLLYRLFFDIIRFSPVRFLSVFNGSDPPVEYCTRSGVYKRRLSLRKFCLPGVLKKVCKWYGLKKIVA